jgi:hypothetical protein
VGAGVRAITGTVGDGPSPPVAGRLDVVAFGATVVGDVVEVNGRVDDVVDEVTAVDVDVDAGRAVVDGADAVEGVTAPAPWLTARTTPPTVQAERTTRSAAPAHVRLAAPRQVRLRAAPHALRECTSAHLPPGMAAW